MFSESICDRKKYSDTFLKRYVLKQIVIKCHVVPQNGVYCISDTKRESFDTKLDVTIVHDDGTVLHK